MDNYFKAFMEEFYKRYPYIKEKIEERKLGSKGIPPTLTEIVEEVLEEEE